MLLLYILSRTFVLFRLSLFFVTFIYLKKFITESTRGAALFVVVECSIFH